MINVKKCKYKKINVLGNKNSLGILTVGICVCVLYMCKHLLI